MVLESTSRSVLVLRLIVGLALLGCARVVGATGAWSVIATAGTDPGQVSDPTGIAADEADSLYVVDQDASYNSQIQKRDAQGTWSVLATSGFILDLASRLSCLPVDTAGDLCVADTGNNRVLKYTPSP